MSQEEFCSKTRLAPRVVAYMCEEGALEPAENPRGRGRRRRFSQENVRESRLVRSLMDFGLDLRRAVPIMGLVRGFFERLRSYEHIPEGVPASLADVSADRPAWLVILWPSTVALRFEVAGREEFTPYVTLRPDGKPTGPFPWDQRLYQSAAVRLEIDLTKVLG